LSQNIPDTNIDPSLDADDVRRFINSLDVRVISCFSFLHRRQRNGPITDRKAFRLCIDDSDKARLLNESKWPQSVFISDWYYLNPAERRRRSYATTYRDGVTAVAAGNDMVSTEEPMASDNAGDDLESTVGDAESTVYYRDENTAVKSLENCVTVNRGD